MKKEAGGFCTQRWVSRCWAHWPARVVHPPMSTPIPLAEPQHLHLLPELPGIREGHSLCHRGEDKLGRHLPTSLCRLGTSAGQPSPGTPPRSHGTAGIPHPCIPHPCIPCPAGAAAPVEAAGDAEGDPLRANPVPKLFRTHLQQGRPDLGLTQPGCSRCVYSLTRNGAGLGRTLPPAQTLGDGFFPETRDGAGWVMGSDRSEAPAEMAFPRDRQGTDPPGCCSSRPPALLPISPRSKNPLSKPQPKATGFHQDWGQ